MCDFLAHAKSITPGERLMGSMCYRIWCVFAAAARTTYKVHGSHSVCISTGKDGIINGKLVQSG